MILPAVRLDLIRVIFFIIGGPIGQRGKGVRQAAGCLLPQPGSLDPLLALVQVGVPGGLEAGEQRRHPAENLRDGHVQAQGQAEDQQRQQDDEAAGLAEQAHQRPGDPTANPSTAGCGFQIPQRQAADQLQEPQDGEIQQRQPNQAFEGDLRQSFDIPQDQPQPDCQQGDRQQVDPPADQEGKGAQPPTGQRSPARGHQAEQRQRAEQGQGYPHQVQLPLRRDTGDERPAFFPANQPFRQPDHGPARAGGSGGTAPGCAAGSASAGCGPGGTF